MENVRYVHDEVTHNFNAASVVLPLLFELVTPRSVLDVGCGIGTWLKVAKDLGVNTVLGVDGEYVDRTLLKVTVQEEFLARDLTVPLQLKRKFDLAICLEVAEHLPGSAARVLVQSLVNHADIILFSAAIPGQGGQNHVNEQWPAYWQNFFNQFNYAFLDYFRPKIWMNSKIEYWYRQNIFLVVNKDSSLAPAVEEKALPLVHPELLEITLRQKNEKIEHLRSRLKKLEGGGYVKEVFKKLVGLR